MQRVRRNAVYRFVPAGWDIAMPQHYTAVSGQLVRVIALPGAPPPNTMGHCHIEDSVTRKFLGMVSTASLQPRRT